MLGTRVGPATRAAVEAERRRLQAGTSDVFVGPVTDDHGTERVPAGSSLPAAERQRIDWFVDGVVVAGPVGTG